MVWDSKPVTIIIIMSNYQACAMHIVHTCMYKQVLLDFSYLRVDRVSDCSEGGVGWMANALVYGDGWKGAGGLLSAALPPLPVPLLGVLMALWGPSA